MSWKTSMLEASFRGLTFHCQATDDSTERALAVHHYPFREGGELDDMGRKARSYSIKAVFFGDSYESELEAFIAVLDEGGEGELVHPVFGAHPVMVQSFSISHDAEGVDFCTVSITFLESGDKLTFFGKARSAKGKAEGAAGSLSKALAAARLASGVGLSAWVKSFLQTMPGSGLIAEVGTIFRTASKVFDDIASIPDLLVDSLDFPQSFVSQLESAASRVREVVSGETSDITSAFVGWQRLSDALPGLTLQGAKSKKYSSTPTLTDGLAPLPPAASSPLLESTAEASTASDTDTPIAPLPHAEQATAVTAAVIDIIQTAELAESAADLLLDEAASPTLRPAEVEALVGNVRERLQDCIDMSRAVFPAFLAHSMTEKLRDAALEVQELGRAVINARPPLVQSTLEAPCSLHLLAHWLYKDYTRAPEILRLNPAIRLPNFLQRGQKVYHYAK